jgi:hypothetical protein
MAFARNNADSVRGRILGVWSRWNRDYLKESAEETSVFAIKRSLVDSLGAFRHKGFEPLRQAKKVQLYYRYGTFLQSQ